MKISNVKKLLLTASGILALALFGGASVHAQEPSETGPAVARVSFLHGDVSMQRGDSGETSAITLNTPLMAGDTLFTNDDSRVEVQLDYANVLRLDADGEANIATLDNNRIQIQISQGVASYSILKGSQADVEIDTANAAVHPLREGRYRIEVFPDGDSQLTVREGQADISTSEGNAQATRGQLIVVHGTVDDAQYRMTGAETVDDFDNWSNDRDRIIFNAESARRTNRYYTGANDLDAYGSWSDEPEYGPVWTPAVDANWAPYREGRWVWEPYWGWTWVSYESWGWAPYHYGRWFVRNNRWSWWPGPVTPVYRPVWAPAYVSFFGFGGGVSLSVGFGSIGWLPTGPCDYYHPWWGGSRERFAVVNIRNSFNDHNGFRPLHGGNRFSNLRDVHVNERLRNGVSGVRAESFGRGGERPRGIRGDEFRDGRMMTGNLPVVPGRESLRVSDRPANFPRNGSSNGRDSRGGGQAGASQRNDRPRFFTNRVPQGSRESFADQSNRVQTAIQRNGNFRPINAGANSNFPDNRRAGSGPVNNATGYNRAVRLPEQDRERPQRGMPQTAQPQAGGRSDGTPRNQERQVPEGWYRFGRRGDQPQASQQGNVPQGNTNSEPNANRGGGSFPGSRGNDRDRFSGTNGQPSNRLEMQGRPDQTPLNGGRATEQSNQPRDIGGNRSNQANTGWQRFYRNNSDNSGNGQNVQPSRPPLDMRQPIVNQRNDRQENQRIGRQENDRGNDGNRGNRPDFRSMQPAPAAPAPRNEPNFRGGDGGGNRRGAPAYSAPAPRSEPSSRQGGNREMQAPVQRSEPSGSNRGASGWGGNRGNDGGGNRGGGGNRDGGGRGRR